jgi:hypothetical protein
VKRPDPELVEQRLSVAYATGDTAEAAHCEALLDELVPPRQPVALISAALWYAKQGLRIFPCQPMSKEPYPRTHGSLDATSDVAQVERWWRARPDSNIAIATGHGVEVVDIDGADGNVSLCGVLRHKPRALEASIGHVSTPRPGGRHFYMRAEGLPNGAAIARGIDYRGRGGYVIAPPSRTAQGLYVWTRALDVTAIQMGDAS